MICCFETIQGLHSGRFGSLGNSDEAKGKETLFGWLMENPFIAYPDCLPVPSGFLHPSCPGSICEGGPRSEETCAGDFPVTTAARLNPLSLPGNVEGYVNLRGKQHFGRQFLRLKDRGHLPHALGNGFQPLNG